MTILDLLRLNDPQLEAATAPGDLAVAAGAGSGKTRTLVARYLGLLESGIPLRAIAAITFTDKAAREMRTRIRRTIVDWLQTSEVVQTCGLPDLLKDTPIQRKEVRGRDLASSYLSIRHLRRRRAA